MPAQLPFLPQRPHSHSKPSSSPSATPRAGPNSRPPRHVKLRVPTSSTRHTSSACGGIITLAYDSAAWQPGGRERHDGGCLWVTR